MSELFGIFPEWINNVMRWLCRWLCRYLCSGHVLVILVSLDLCHGIVVSVYVCLFRLSLSVTFLVRTYRFLCSLDLILSDLILLAFTNRSACCLWLPYWTYSGHSSSEDSVTIFPWFPDRFIQKGHSNL